MSCPETAEFDSWESVRPGNDRRVRRSYGGWHAGCGGNGGRRKRPNTAVRPGLETGTTRIRLVALSRICTCDDLQV